MGWLHVGLCPRGWGAAPRRIRVHRDFAMGSEGLEQINLSILAAGASPPAAVPPFVLAHIRRGCSLWSSTAPCWQGASAAIIDRLVHSRALTADKGLELPGVDGASSIVNDEGFAGSDADLDLL